MPSICRLWPFKLDRLGFSFLMALIHAVTSFLDSGHIIPDWCFHENRWAACKTGLIWKCVLIATLRSTQDVGSCRAQWVSSLFSAALVMGSMKCMTGSPW